MFNNEIGPSVTIDRNIPKDVAVQGR
jgi:hypothetical protein